jgi:hypothetical protein
MLATGNGRNVNNRRDANSSRQNRNIMDKLQQQGGMLAIAGMLTTKGTPAVADITGK